MKQITFTIARPTDQSMQDLRDAVIRFLTRNGMNEGDAPNYVSVGPSAIYISPSCSNYNFTRALALFQLIFSVESAGAYISYRNDETWTMKLSIVGHVGHTIRDVIKHIEAHSEITIQ
jgi:hypothetical protein